MILSTTQTPHVMGATSAWRAILETILAAGEPVAPRGQATREVLDAHVSYPAAYPAVVCPPRKLSRKFLAAEAYWILSGDDRVETIAPFNGRIAEFSDDGKTFFGAYGPPFREQLPYVVENLVADRDSRQAIIDIWRPAPPPTKDVPCTLNVQYLIRPGYTGPRLHAIFTMRSSDAWLGIPYDLFNFAMMTWYVAAEVNAAARARHDFDPVVPGTVHWRAGSSHLYARDYAGAVEVLGYLRRATGEETAGPRVPKRFATEPSAALVAELDRARHENRYAFA